MIKSSKVTLKFSNPGKLTSLGTFIDEYRRVTSCIIDMIWGLEKVPKFISKEITDPITTWLSARAIQCAGKQASGIVRGTRKKYEQRAWKISDLHDRGYHKQARKLERIQEKQTISKPIISTIQPELDSRFIEINLSNLTTFDGWIVISSIGDKLKISIPFKRHKHFNKLYRSGILKKGIRLSKEMATFMFEVDKSELKEDGEVLGIDVGISSLLSCSDGVQSTKNQHGHDLNTISKMFLRKKKGSKAFKKAQLHRTNFINQAVNQLNLDVVKEIRLENIKHLRKGKKTSKFLSHWVYSELFEKLESYCLEQGVLVRRISPTYTSQRCSDCGWTRKSNRKGKLFKCGSCGYHGDSDLNAARNIQLDLRPIGKAERLQQNNRIGFFWVVEGQEKHIVPDVRKVQNL